MAQQKDDLQVGHEIADLLHQWRPEINGEDVAGAIMIALERYSITVEGGSEHGMRSCLFKLKDMVETRIRGL